SLLTHLAQHSWSLFEYSELLDLHHVGFYFVSSPGFEQEWSEATHALELLACTSASHQCCVIINSHKSLSTSQLTRDWTVITCVSGSTRNPRCSHLHIESKLLSRGLSMALDVHLKSERSTPFGPYKTL